MTAHSIISPSGSHIWVLCPGAAIMQAQAPEGETTLEANTGTATHLVGADIIAKPAPREKYVDKYRLKGVLVTDDMFDAAQLYADEVRRIAGGDARLEERISAPTIHLESFGTCDAFYYDHRIRTLYIWDLKYGFASVDAFENWQLLNYAAGILENPNNSAADADNVVLTIVQPRDYGPLGPIKTWAISIDDIQLYFDRLRAAAADAFSEKPTIRPGRHCRYCRARHACEAARLAAADAFDYTCEPVLTELNAEQLGRELEILEKAKNAIEHRYTGIATTIEQMIRIGQNVPQWELKPKSSRLEWTISADDLAHIDPQLTKTVPITPKQAIKAGIDKDIVNALTETKPGKSYLQPYKERFSKND